MVLERFNLMSFILQLQSTPIRIGSETMLPSSVSRLYMATFGTQFFSAKCYHCHLFTTFVMRKTNKWKSTVRDHGFYIDSDLPMRSHVQRTVASCFDRQMAQCSSVSATHDARDPAWVVSRYAWNRVSHEHGLKFLLRTRPTPFERRLVICDWFGLITSMSVVQTNYKLK